MPLYDELEVRTPQGREAAAAAQRRARAAIAGREWVERSPGGVPVQPYGTSPSGLEEPWRLEEELAVSDVFSPGHAWMGEESAAPFRQHGALLAPGEDPENYRRRGGVGWGGASDRPNRTRVRHVQTAVRPDITADERRNMALDLTMAQRLAELEYMTEGGRGTGEVRPYRGDGGGLSVEDLGRRFGDEMTWEDRLDFKRWQARLQSIAQQRQAAADRREIEGRFERAQAAREAVRMGLMEGDEGIVPPGFFQRER